MDEQAQVLFDAFVQASTCRATLSAFEQVCLLLGIQPGPRLYHTLRPRLDYWRVRGLWARLDKRATHTLNQKGFACANTTCLIIGAGPCGLRTAIELAFLGARVLLLEKRDSFSRNNVLHLWPCTIHDLRGLGAKKFYGQFCAGSIDHISIRQLQLILLKVALLLGVEVHVNVEFKDLNEPSDEQQTGWRAVVNPKNHPISQIDIDVVIGADGRRNTLPGFRRKEFRGKLAIAITANFINRRTRAEAQAQEISGVAFIFNQSFFQELRAHTGIDLENIVYYKDDTHYFVMTAKKQSLLKKGVILRDYADTEQLLSRANVDQNALLSYAREAADFSTNHQLPVLDFAINHYGQPDVAMFDFTCMYASENAALVRQRGEHSLLLTLVGDSLLEPFWPMGTGIARGFMAAMDTAWMIRSWALGSTPLEVLAERESVYRLLPQTTPENISKNFAQYSLDPHTRYPNINKRLINPSQVCHLLDTGDGGFSFPERLHSTPQMTRQESMARSNALLNWCQEQTRGYRGVNVCDFTSSWRNGLALCALIHHNRPDLIDFDALDPRGAVSNGQLGLDVAEREFGISPIMTGTEMSLLNEADSLSMVVYLSQIQQLLKDATPSAEGMSQSGTLISSISLLNKLGHSFSRKRNPNPKDKKEKEEDRGKRRKTSQAGQSEEEDMPSDHHGNESSDVAGVMDESLWLSAGGNHNRVRSMATLLLAKFEENAPSPSPLTNSRRQPPGGVCASDVCFFCGRRVYALERLSAEGKFFHRSCFQCALCSATLRLASYTYDELQGKFYCKQHYEQTLTGIHRRKSTAATFYSMSTQATSSIPLSESTPSIATAAALPPLTLPHTPRTPSSPDTQRQTHTLAPPASQSQPNTPTSPLPPFPLHINTPTTPQTHTHTNLTIQKNAQTPPHTHSIMVPPHTFSFNNMSAPPVTHTHSPAVDTHTPTSVVPPYTHATPESPASPMVTTVAKAESPENILVANTSPPHTHSHTHSASHTPNGALAATRGLLRLEPGTLSLPPHTHSHTHSPTTPERIELEYCMPPPPPLPQPPVPVPHALALTHGHAHVTPERIELENYTPSHSHTLSPASPMLEVPEETLTQHNLSQRELSGEEPSSSESDLEELEDLQAREEREREGGRQTDERRVGTKEEVEKTEGGEEEVAESGEEEGEDYADSSDEGEYSPWERERWSGVWLGPVTEEDEAGLVKEPSEVEDYPDHYGSLDTPDVSVMTDAKFSLSSSSTLLCSALTSHTQPSSPTLTQTSTPQQSAHTPTHTPPNTPPETMEKRSVRRSEVIQEFWMKSSEIRKRLGATPRAHTHVSARSRHTHAHGHTTGADGSTPPADERAGEGKCVCEECVCAEVARRLTVMEQNLLTPPCSPATHANSNSNSNSNANSEPNLFDGSEPKLDTEFDPSLIPDLSVDPDLDLSLDPEADPMPCCKVDFDPGSRSVPLVCEVLLSSSAPVQSVADAKTYASADPDTQVTSDAQACVGNAHPRPDTDPPPSHFVYPDTPEKKEMYTQTSSSTAAGRPKLAENGTSGGHGHSNNVAMHAGRAVEPRVVVEAEQRRRLGIFSPRKTASASAAHTLPSPERPKHKSLWKSVFSGYRRKKKEAEPAGAVAGGNQEAGKRRSQASSRNTDLRFKKNLTFAADSSLSCSDVLERLPLRAQLSFEPSDIQKDIIKEEEEGEDDFNGDERRSARPRRPVVPQTPPDASCSTEVVGVWVVPPDPSSLSVSTDILQELQEQRQPLSHTQSLAESSDPRQTRRIQREAQRHAKQQELKRLHRAQMIQRQLEQVEVKQRQLEEMGVAVEKALRGEADYWEDSNSTAVLDMHLGVSPSSPLRRPAPPCPCTSSQVARGDHEHSLYVCLVFFLYVVQQPPLHQLISVGSPQRRRTPFCPCSSSNAMGARDDPSLMQQWFKLVQEKNALVRYESELMIFARELELEDRQSRLQQELRERMAVDDHLKGEEELAEERSILCEMLEVVEQRDWLVSLLEDQRLKEREEDRDLEATILSKGFSLHWT
ncbi:protein-methionine sulfoxide oxidase mical3b [Sardina pilchardus]|uniref:protein-methionine sulfoxide oxidase mical3b n=1 Tax=Sardina pilchardus TaxID=27697 RepID=UPI002E11E84F